MKYPMGTFVKVDGYMKRFKRPHFGHVYNSIWFTHTPIAAQIGMVVGMRHAQAGDVDWGDEGSSFMVPTDYFTFYAVSFGAFNRPVLVREEDMTPAEPVKLPMLAGKHAEWDDKARAEQRQYAAEQKRVKGRFAR